MPIEPDFRGGGPAPYARNRVTGIGGEPNDEDWASVAVDTSGGSVDLARAWARAVGGLAYVPLSAAEVVEYLGRLTDELVEALRAEPFSAEPASEVGAALVAAHFVGPEVLGRTVAVLGTDLAAVATENGAATQGGADPAPRVAALLGAVATGYADALLRRTLDGQEQLRQAISTAQAQAEERFRAVFAGAAIGMGIADVRGRILDVNQALADMLGYPPAELCRLNVRDFAHPDDEPGNWASFEAIARGDRNHSRREKRFVRKDGTTVVTDMTTSLLRDGRGRPRYLVAMMQDVTERHRLHAQLRHEALHDPLTGLPNRRRFFERMAEVFDAAAPGDRVGLCYVDLDGFKAVNDTLGHDVGDRLLGAVADRLRACTSRLGQFVARIGGDEFVVLVADSRGTAEVVEVARTVLAALDAPVRVDGHDLPARASVGVVERAVSGTTAADLMQAADTTLHWAKSDGPRSWAVFDAGRHDREVTRYTLAGTMPAALARGEFTLDYQPLVRLSDGAVLGVEALVRWRHPQYGLLQPGRFIDVAEETGLIVPLGRWVLEQACLQASRWRAAGGGLFVSVNLAVRQIQDPAIVASVEKVLAETGLDAGLLQLELTESAVMDTAGEPLRNLRALSAMGLRIAVDDFGTGYSNLAYLCDLPVHTLKLAGQFVAGLRGRGSAGVDPAKERIVATLIGLAHGLGLSATAEGVETAEQADRLCDLHCDTAQGWHFAPPGPAHHITHLARAAGAGGAAGATGAAHPAPF